MNKKRMPIVWPKEWDPEKGWATVETSPEWAERDLVLRVRYGTTLAERVEALGGPPVRKGDE